MKDLLNRNQIMTWMAPYDLLAGSDYTDEIPNAIEYCSCFIVLLSNSAQSSKWVPKEVERAVNFGRIIIPIKIENFVTNKNFSFLLGNCQSVTVQQIDESQSIINTLLKRIKDIVGIEDDSNKKDILFQEKIDFIENKLNNMINKLDRLLNYFESNKIEKEFNTILLELNSILPEYKKAFRLANQEDVNRTSYALQNICFQLFEFYEKYLNTEHHKIAAKAGQITLQYNVYVEKYNAFVEELSIGYSDKSNERALEAENEFSELTKIIKSLLN